MVLNEELSPRASGTLEVLKTFAVIVGLVIPALVIGFYYGSAATVSPDSLARFVSCMDANVPGCSNSIPSSYSRCRETTAMVVPIQSDVEVV